MRLFRRGLTISLAAALLGCGEQPPDPAYVDEIEAWREQRLAALTSETGWLTLVGLSWLEPGANRIGSAPSNQVVLRGEGVPPVAGVLELAENGTVTLRTTPESGITIDGEPVDERRLATDLTGEPDVVALGPLRLHVIERGGAVGVRIRDLASPARERFHGIEHFPVDERYRVAGAFEPYDEALEVEVPSHQGPDQTMLAPGIIRFSLGGATLSLEPYVSSPESETFFIVFRDATSGETTYGAGRFLSAAAPRPGFDEVLLDFNRATNPPCAFTPYATCPVATARNTLPVAIEAGEKAGSEVH